MHVFNGPNVFRLIGPIQGYIWMRVMKSCMDCGVWSVERFCRGFGLWRVFDLWGFALNVIAII